jgi:hypothetical protein
VAPNDRLSPYTFPSYPFEQVDLRDRVAQTEPQFVATEGEIAHLYHALGEDDFDAIAAYCQPEQHDYDRERYTVRQWGRTRAIFALALMRRSRFAEALQELMLCRQFFQDSDIEPEGHLQIALLLGAVADIEHQVGMSATAHLTILDAVAQIEREGRALVFTRGSAKLLTSSSQIALSSVRFIRNAQRQPGDLRRFNYLDGAYASLAAAVAPWQTWSQAFFHWEAPLGADDLLKRELPQDFANGIINLATISTDGPLILRIIMQGRHMLHTFDLWKVRLLGTEDDGDQMQMYTALKAFADFYAQVAFDDAAMLLTNYQYLIEVALEMAQRTPNLLQAAWMSKARGTLEAVGHALEARAAPKTCDPRLFVLFGFELEYVEMLHTKTTACASLISKVETWLARCHPNCYFDVYLLGRGYVLLARLHRLRNHGDSIWAQWQRRALELFNHEPYADPLWGWAIAKLGI